MANVHTVIFSPLNISLPTLILLQIRCPKITDKVLGLDITNRLSFSQAYASLLVESIAKTQKKGKKEEMEIYSRGSISYKFMPGRPSLPGYHDTVVRFTFKTRFNDSGDGTCSPISDNISRQRNSEFRYPLSATYSIDLGIAKL
jgi:hypothetical protein